MILCTLTGNCGQQRLLSVSFHSLLRSAMPAQLHFQSSITSTCLNTNLAHFSSFHAEHQFYVPFFQKIEISLKVQ